VRATPAARRIAAERGVDLRSVAPGAADGVIYADDVRASVTTAPAATAAPAESGDREEVPVSRTRRIIAERMLESHRTVPAVSLTMKVDATALVHLRGDLRRDEAEVPSINDFVVRAVGLALREHEAFRTHMIDSTLYRYRDANVGIAVDTDGGLLVPVIHHADTRTIHEITAESRRLAALARDGRLGPEDVAGGVFTVSNLGMFGVESFTAMINPPQSGILSVGAAAPECRCGEAGRDEVTVMRLGLTMDHRVADGAQGARFLQSIRGVLEDPSRLMPG
jgi:pyruvate dehydrogenase E2 component (dihydrolipoamide acetyltransferase)